MFQSGCQKTSGVTVNIHGFRFLNIFHNTILNYSPAVPRVGDLPLIFIPTVGHFHLLSITAVGN